MSKKAHPEPTVHKHHVWTGNRDVGIWRADPDAVRLLLEAFGYCTVPPVQKSAHTPAFTVL